MQVELVPSDVGLKIKTAITYKMFDAIICDNRNNNLVEIVL